VTDDEIRTLVSAEYKLAALEALHRERYRRLCAALGVEHPTYEAALEHAIVLIEQKQRFLLHVVDTVWRVAHESDQVPSTEWSRRMLVEAQTTYEQQVHARHVVSPTSLLTK